jgi:threonine synthase
MWSPDNIEPIVNHRCVACWRHYPEGFHPFCDACGSMVEVEYALESVQLADSTNPYVRFAQLLPLTTPRSCLPQATYTPVVHASRLGRALGMKSLYLKNETILPTKSTKDRMAAVSLAYLHERGVRAFCASSTGNSATSFAYAIRAYPDMHLFLFTAEEFLPRMQYTDQAQVTHFGMRDASFVEASEYAGVYARRHGLVSESGFFNPGRREGLKLAFLEASEQVPQPIDWYVQAVSSAMGVYGAYKGAQELLQMKRLQQLPRLLCVQQESCAPMARAFADGSETIRPEDLVARPRGIAEAILRGNPTRAYPHVRRIVMESGGGFVVVSEAEIREARKKVEDAEGISPCFSASAAVAGLVQLARDDAFLRNSVVLLNLTGADRLETEQSSNIEWLRRTSGGWIAPPPAAALRQLKTGRDERPITAQISPRNDLLSP